MKTMFGLLLLVIFAATEAAAIPLLDFKFDKRCLGGSTVFTDVSCCNITQWEWDFGEPASGSANKAYTKLA